MTDIRTRLEDALHNIVDEYQAGNLTIGEGVDVLLSQPGIAIVEVPIRRPPAWTGEDPWPGDAVLEAWR